MSNFDPTVADVAALMRSRTTERGSGGAQAGTFTANTIPTADEVELLIAKAVGKVAERVGDTVPDTLVEAATDAAVLRTGMLIELSYFGDQISAGRSPYNEMRQEYREAIIDLAASVTEAQAAEGLDDNPNVPTGLPSWAFPSLGPSEHAPGSEIPHPYGLDW